MIARQVIQGLRSNAMRHWAAFLKPIQAASRASGCAFVKGVGTIVKERISSAGRGEAGDQRPMLLFPEGTTTNGRYLLPFKSGAFLAGYPVQPVILHYQQAGPLHPSPCLPLLHTHFSLHPLLQTHVDFSPELAGWLLEGGCEGLGAYSICCRD